MDAGSIPARAFLRAALALRRFAVGRAAQTGGTARRRTGRRAAVSQRKATERDNAHWSPPDCAPAQSETSECGESEREGAESDESHGRGVVRPVAKESDPVRLGRNGTERTGGRGTRPRGPRRTRTRRKGTRGIAAGSQWGAAGMGRLARVRPGGVRQKILANGTGRTPAWDRSGAGGRAWDASRQDATKPSATRAETLPHLAQTHEFG